MGPLGRLTETELIERASKIRMIVTDVDGVLTNGQITYDALGHESKSFDVRDGFGIRCWIHHGGLLAIITGRKSSIVQQRARELGIQYVYQGTIEKGKTVAQLATESRIQPHEMCAIGDDLPDGPMLHRCGLSAAPADASPELASTVNWVTKKAGGQGAVRELIEMIMQAQGTWQEVCDFYLKSSREENIAAQ